MSELPTILKPGQSIELEASDAIEVLTVAPAVKSRSDFATVVLPYISTAAVEGFQDESHRIDLKRVTQKRLVAAKALRRGMVAESVRMADGSEVRTNSDAIYCLLDLISAKMDLSENQ